MKYREAGHRNQWLVLVVTVALTLVSATGLTFSQSKPGDRPCVEEIRLGGEEGETVLSPGDLAETGVAFQNSGKAPRYLRAKLYVPQAGGLDLLEPGTREQGSFLPCGGTVRREGAYWLRQGEYICYKNSETGDLLLPGQQSPPLYDAVRVSPALDSQELPQATDYEIYVLAESALAGEGAKIWEPVPAKRGDAFL